MTLGSNALTIQKLSPGIHIEELDTVFEKAFDLSFTVETNINCTKDLIIIKKHLNNFDALCESYKENNNWNKYCKNIFALLQTEANNTIKEIQSAKNHKIQKRLAPIFTVLGRLLAKYAPEILMSMGLIYQQSEINNLNNDADSAKKTEKNSTTFIKYYRFRIQQSGFKNNNH